MYCYSQGDAFAGEHSSEILRFSLGNLGHAEPVCMHQFLQLFDPIEVSCKKGKISGFHGFGIIPEELSKRFDE